MSEPVSDGNSDFLGGQDHSKHPDKIPPNAYFSGINVSTKQGVLGPRWGQVRRELDTTDLNGFIPFTFFRTYADAFYTGKFQGTIPYKQGDTRYSLVIISGVIYLINTLTNKVSILPISDGSYISQTHVRVNWEFAGDAVVIHDFPDFPVIIEGFIARRADPALDEIPISRMGAYNQNRLFIVNGGSEFTAGDPAGSLATPNAPLTFIEILAPASPYFGQIFDLPTNVANLPVTAMTFLQVADTGTGLGPLILATRNAIYTVQSQNPRSAWENGQFGTILVYECGIAGQRAYTNVNSDLFFMSADVQIRTLSMSRNDQGRWSRVPISKEVENWLIGTDRELYKYAAMSYFLNTVFTTVNPTRVMCQNRQGGVDIDVVFRGMLPLDLDNISGLGTEARPAWDGIWIGIRPLDFCVFSDQMFCVAKDGSNVNAFYELTPESSIDYIGNVTRYPRTRVYTREYAFETPLNLKKLRSIMFNLAQLQGDIKISVAFKPSHGNRFIPWFTRQYNAPWRTCEVPTDEEVNGFSSHNLRDFIIGEPPEALKECDPVTKEIYSVFKKIQLRIDIEGKYWEIDDFLIQAILVPQPLNRSACENTGGTIVPNECIDDWELGELSLCLTTQT